MSARIGAVDDTSVNAVTMNSPAIPASTPSSAVTNVIPAATSDPKVTTSTTAATATPMTSVAPISGTPALICPPGTTRRSPELSPLRPSYPSTLSWDSSSAGLSNWTLIRPVEPSGLIALLVNGSTAPITSGTFETLATVAPTAAFTVGSASVLPSGAFTTTVADAPLAAGPLHPAGGGCAARGGHSLLGGMGGALRFGAGDGEGVGGLAPGGERPDAQQDKEERPHSGYEPPALIGDPAEPVQQIGHRKCVRFGSVRRTGRGNRPPAKAPVVGRAIGSAASQQPPEGGVAEAAEFVVGALRRIPALAEETVHGELGHVVLEGIIGAGQVLGQLEAVGHQPGDLGHLLDHRDDILQDVDDAAVHDGEIDEALDREILRRGLRESARGREHLGHVGGSRFEDSGKYGRLATEVVEHGRLGAPGRGRDVLQ